MKVQKRIVIVADIVCDEDFDCDQLLIAQDITAHRLGGSAYVGRGEDGEWEVRNYVFQDDVVLSNEVMI